MRWRIEKEVVDGKGNFLIFCMMKFYKHVQKFQPHQLRFSRHSKSNIAKNLTLTSYLKGRNWTFFDRINSKFESVSQKNWAVLKILKISEDLRKRDQNPCLGWHVSLDQLVNPFLGQFQCGNKKCTVMEGLRSWEVNFAYAEDQEKKNALVKLSE